MTILVQLMLGTAKDPRNERGTIISMDVCSSWLVSVNTLATVQKGIQNIDFFNGLLSKIKVKYLEP